MKRGDVVLVDFPFTSGSVSKKRPALVVQCDRNNGRLQDTIVAIRATWLPSMSQPDMRLMKRIPIGRLPG